MSDEPQEVAENLDEERVSERDDRTGDEFGEGLPGHPPDRPQGVNTVGVTPIEEDAGESFAERTRREEPEAWRAPSVEGGDVGQLVDESAAREDQEEQLVAEELPATELGPEERAMHHDDGEGSSLGR
jgi:hypothetical protein